MPFDVDAEVVGNTRLSDEYNVLELHAPTIASATQPGQFVMLKTSRRGDPLLRRPFSVFEILRDAEGQPSGVSIFNKRIGIGTSQLAVMRPGDRVSCLGPLGKPFVPVDAASQAWMVAGGVGLAPFVTLAEALAARRTPTTLFYGGRSASDLYRDELFTALGVSLVLTTDDGSRGEHGRITAPLERALAALPPRQPVTIYTCGPTPMMRAVAALGARFDRQVFVSLEQVMGCGMGGCYSCVVRVHERGAPHFVRSCIEGPVFDAPRIIWDELVH